MAYTEVFAYQLKNAARRGRRADHHLSSGDSENIVRALDWAGNNGMTTIALSVSPAGAAPRWRHQPPCRRENYGVVEDVHQSLIHILAQYVRMSELPSELCSRSASD